MNKINLCPFRTYTEVRPAVCIGHGDVTVTGFMNCLKEECPAFYHNTQNNQEYCKRLSWDSGLWVEEDE